MTTGWATTKNERAKAEHFQEDKQFAMCAKGQPLDLRNHAHCIENLLQTASSSKAHEEHTLNLFSQEETIFP